MTPPWLDQVLFDLQGLKPEQLSPWERDFLPSVSLQLAKHGRITDPQLRSLKRMYGRLFPSNNIESFKRFSEQEALKDEMEKLKRLYEDRMKAHQERENPFKRITTFEDDIPF